MPLPNNIKGLKIPAAKKTAPVWKGPEDAGPQGGVTQGLCAKWLSCRERFRVHAIEGLKPAPAFNHCLEYGNLHHVCEEALAKRVDWQQPLTAYAKQLCRRYPLQQNEVEKWYNCCRVQFPIYMEHWSKHPDVRARMPLLAEEVFHVPYKLPSGRTVFLRGKFDSVDLVDGGLWLMENKTKSELDPELLSRQLGSGYEWQTGVYAVALAEYQRQPGQYRLGGQGVPRGAPFKGVRYNVIKRPLSGGKGSIVQGKGTKGTKCSKCKGQPGIGHAVCPKCNGVGRLGGKPAETAEAFYARLGEVIKAEPEEFFLRLNVGLLAGDVERFRRNCLDPILENLCQWYDTVALGKAPKALPPWAVSWRTPYNLFDGLAGGGEGEVDNYLMTGSPTGLQKMDDLFPELAGA